MINDVENKTIAEIDAEFLQKAIDRYGDIIQATWVTLNHDMCEIGVTTILEDRKPVIILISKEDLLSIAADIDRTHCFLFAKSTTEIPLPVVVKYQGRVFVLSPYVEIEN